MQNDARQPLEAGDISQGGLRLFRERAGFYIGLALLLFGPGYACAFVAQALQMEHVVAIYAGIFDGQPPPTAMAQPPLVPTLISLVGNGLLFVGLVLFEAALASAGLAQLRGERLGVFESIEAGGFAPLWMALFEIPYFMVTLVGFVCCIFPGIGVGLLVASFCPFVNVVLVAEKRNVFDAVSRSVALTEGDRGAHLVVGLTFFALHLALTVVVAALMIAIAYVVSDGFTSASEAAIRRGVSMVTALSAVSMPVTVAMWSWLHLARVYAYGKRLGGDVGGRPELAGVFA